MSNELRWNPLLGCWIIVSAKRRVRPWREKFCPFCPGTEETGYGWDVLVLDNKYPALRRDAVPSRTGYDIYRVRPGYGYCKVVVETREHEGDLDTIPYLNLVKYIQTLVEETRKLCGDEKIEYVAVFRNKGEVIGVSLTHPHSQIYALPFIPPKLKIEMKNSRKYHEEKGECLFCHIIELEKKEKKRILYENRSFVGFLPFFATWPYEAHIYPQRHFPKLTEMSLEEVEDLADILKVIVAMYNSLFDFSLPYIMFFHQAPCKGDHEYFHFHVEFYPVHRSKDKLKYAAGIEWGAWVFTYDDIPENKAEELRQALRRALTKLSEQGYTVKGKMG